MVQRICIFSSSSPRVDLVFWYGFCDRTLNEWNYFCDWNESLEVKHFSTLLRCLDITENFLVTQYSLNDPVLGTTVCVILRLIFPRDPKNSNQELGLAYRKRQITVLKRAMQPITSRLNNCFFLYSSYCQHPHLVANQRDGYHNESSPSIRVELLSLECAFDWLSSTYPSVFTAAEDIIATDQEESKPLNWAALVADVCILGAKVSIS